MCCIANSRSSSRAVFEKGADQEDSKGHGFG